MALKLQVKAATEWVRKLPLGHLFFWVFIVHSVYFNALYELFDYFGIHPATNPALEFFGAGVFVLLLGMPFLVFFEELIFRLPIVLIVKHMKSIFVRGLLVSILCILFAMLHVGNYATADYIYILLNQGVGGIFLSLLFAETFLRTKSSGIAFWAVWLYHVLFNYHLFLLDLLMNLYF